MPAGVEKILKGIMKYRSVDKLASLQRNQSRLENPHEFHPQSLLFTCMDTRVLSSEFAHSELGDNYIVRNPGNMVPRPDDACCGTPVTTESSALELGVIRNNIQHVVVCGHSDCKALILLHKLHENLKRSDDSPLESWVSTHGDATLKKFRTLSNDNNFSGPLRFMEGKPQKSFDVFIDPENKHSVVDKLSQLNTIQQLENIASYSFLKDKLANKGILLHALWYDISSANVFMLSRKHQQFVKINETSYDGLMNEVKDIISSPVSLGIFAT